MCTLKKGKITNTCINSFNKKYINKNYNNNNNNNIINNCNNSSSKENFNCKGDNFKIITLKKSSSLSSSSTTTTTTITKPSRRKKKNILKNLNCFNYSCNIFRSSFMCTTEKSPSKMANTITNVIRNVVSKQRKRYVANGYDLDLSYICDNIIAMGYPAANIEKWYRNHIDDVVKFLEENHKDHYRIYNLCSERNYDISTFHGRVAVFPFADHNPPTIELMQKFCDDMNSWLKSDERNVAAVHCKAGKGRTGTMICCYLLQCGFARTADEALSYYDEKRTKDKKGVTIPSQRRYVEYYAKLLTSGKPYERRTLQICEIRFSSPPLSSSQGTVLSLSTLDDPSCPDKVKILQNFAIDFRKASNVEITDRCIPLTGDVRIELYHKVTKKTLLHLWFNVYFIDEEGERHVNGDDMKIIYEFKKTEIDDAHKDKENKLFTEDFSVQLVFQTIPSRNSYVNACGDKTDNLDMNPSVHGNYHHGRIYSNSAVLSANNYIVDNVGSSQTQQMDIQPVIEPLKQQNHNNSNNTSSLLNNSNLTIRHQQHQQQQRQQQEQYAFPTNQNQYKQQQNRNIIAIGPMNVNSTTNSPTASATHNSNNSSTISVKNKNLSLDLSSSLVISPQKQQQQYQQEQQSQLHQNLHEKQILQQQLHNNKNNIKNPGKISSKHNLQQQPLEQPSSNKTVVISSNQQFQQQQQNQPHESRTNSTSSNTSKSSSNSSSSISISSAASSSACIGEDWESGEFKVNNNHSTSSADVILLNRSKVTSNIKKKFNNQLIKNKLSENYNINILNSNISDNNISKKYVNLQHNLVSKKQVDEPINQTSIQMMTAFNSSLNNDDNEENGIIFHKMNNDDYRNNSSSYETTDSNIKNLDPIKIFSNVEANNDLSKTTYKTNATISDVKTSEKKITSLITSDYNNYLINNSNFSKLNSCKSNLNNSNNYRTTSRATNVNNDESSEICSSSSSSNVISDNLSSNFSNFKQEANSTEIFQNNNIFEKATNSNLIDDKETFFDNISSSRRSKDKMNDLLIPTSTTSLYKSDPAYFKPKLGTNCNSILKSKFDSQKNVSVNKSRSSINPSKSLNKSYSSSHSLRSVGEISANLPLSNNPLKQNKLKMWLKSFNLKKSDPEFNKNFKFVNIRNRFKHKTRKNSKRTLHRHSSKKSSIYKISNENLNSENILNDFVVVEDLKFLDKYKLSSNKEESNISSKNELLNNTKIDAQFDSFFSDILLPKVHTSFSENLECEPESENLENKELSILSKTNESDSCDQNNSFDNVDIISTTNNQLKAITNNSNISKSKQDVNNSCNQLGKSVESVDFYSSLCDRQLSFGTSPLSKSPQSFIGSYGAASGIGTSPASISHLKLIDENPLEDETIKTPTIIAKPINSNSIGFFTFKTDENKIDGNEEEDIDKNKINENINISNKITKEEKEFQHSAQNYPSVINLRNYFENEGKYAAGLGAKSSSYDELDAKMFFDSSNHDCKQKKFNQSVLTQAQPFSTSSSLHTSTVQQQQQQQRQQQQQQQFTRSPFNFTYIKKCLNDISDEKSNSYSIVTNSNNNTSNSATTSTTNVFKRGSIP